MTVLLVFLSTVVAANPVRALLLLPSAERATAGLRVITLALPSVLVAIAAGPLVSDVLSVSPSSFLVGVGAVLIAQGGHDLIRRPKTWPGVAPTALTPGVVMVAAGWAMTSGWVAALAVAPGFVVALVAMVLMQSRGWPGPRLIRLGRITGFLVIAAGAWHLWEGLTRV